MPAQEWKLRSLADQKKERKGIEIGKSGQYGLESGKIQTAAGKGRTGRSEISIEKGIFLIRFLKKKKDPEKFFRKTGLWRGKRKRRSKRSRAGKERDDLQEKELSGIGPYPKAEAVFAEASGIPDGR